MTTLVDSILELKRRCGIDAEISSGLSLTARESALLDSLRHADGPHARDVAWKLNLSPSRLSRLLTSLTGKGLVRLEPDQHDRRAVRVVFTAKGKKAAERIDQLKCACEERLYGRLKAGDIETIKQGLQLLLHAL